VIVTLHLHN